MVQAWLRNDSRQAEFVCTHREATSLQDHHEGQTAILQRVQGAACSGLQPRLFLGSVPSLIVWGMWNRRAPPSVMRQSTAAHPKTAHLWGLWAHSQHTGIKTRTRTSREQRPPITPKQSADKLCLFQHDGAPCHRAELIFKWLGEQNIHLHHTLE